MKSLADLTEKEKDLFVAIIKEDLAWFLRMQEGVGLQVSLEKSLPDIEEEILDIVLNPEPEKQISEETRRFILPFLENDLIWVKAMLEKLVLKRRVVRFFWKIWTKLSFGGPGFEALEDIIENIKQLEARK